MKYINETKAKLLDILRVMAPESSANTLRTWLQSGRVTVDEKRVEKANAEILPGQEVAVGPKVSFLRSLKILQEDDEMVVLEKPEGLLSVATDIEKRANVHSMLKKRPHQRKVYPVHRLDRETSGVMIFAYTENARDHLKSQFEEHQIEKVYYAVVENQMAKGNGTWECLLEEDDFYYVKSSAFGKHAITHYEVLKALPQRSFLRLKPQTGRKNQLRVHCSEAGYPMVGDKKYGAVSNPIKRLCLHAEKITFTHPGTNKRLTFTVPIPESFLKLMHMKEMS